MAIEWMCGELVRLKKVLLSEKREKAEIMRRIQQQTANNKIVSFSSMRSVHFNVHRTLHGKCSKPSIYSLCKLYLLHTVLCVCSFHSVYWVSTSFCSYHFFVSCLSDFVHILLAVHQPVQLRPAECYDLSLKIMWCMGGCGFRLCALSTLLYVSRTNPTIFFKFSNKISKWSVCYSMEWCCLLRQLEWRWVNIDVDPK